MRGVVALKLIYNKRVSLYKEGVFTFVSGIIIDLRFLFGFHTYLYTLLKIF